MAWGGKGIIASLSVLFSLPGLWDSNIPSVYGAWAPWTALLKALFNLGLGVWLIIAGLGLYGSKAWARKNLIWACQGFIFLQGLSLMVLTAPEFIPAGFSPLAFYYKASLAMLSMLSGLSDIGVAIILRYYSSAQTGVFFPGVPGMPAQGFSAGGLNPAWVCALLLCCKEAPLLFTFPAWARTWSESLRGTGLPLCSLAVLNLTALTAVGVLSLAVLLWARSSRIAAGFKATATIVILRLLCTLGLFSLASAATGIPGALRAASAIATPLLTMLQYLALWGMTASLPGVLPEIPDRLPDA